MTASKRIVKYTDVEEEIEALGLLWKDCEAFLVKWRAYEFTLEDSPSDAFVAIFNLQQQINVRREYLFAKYVQETLPF